MARDAGGQGMAATGSGVHVGRSRVLISTVVAGRQMVIV